MTSIPMTHRILTLLAVCAVSFVQAGLSAEMKDEAASASESQPKLYAIAIHADWCGNCKALAPQVMAARANLGKEPVKFIKFDHTSPETRVESGKTAAKMGLTSIFNDHTTTGQLILVDAATREVVATFDRNSGATRIREEIEARL